MMKDENFAKLSVNDKIDYNRIENKVISYCLCSFGCFILFCILGIQCLKFAFNDNEFIAGIWFLLALITIVCEFIFLVYGFAKQIKADMKVKKILESKNEKR